VGPSLDAKSQLRQRVGDEATSCIEEGVWFMVRPSGRIGQASVLAARASRLQLR
jgi:hypothetical protein